MRHSHITPNKEMLNNISVLYAEDDISIHRQLQRFLSQTVKTVYPAFNGKEGLELYKKHTPDVIITDIRMPVLDGLKMSKLIREIDPEIPIIVLTAFNEQEYFLKSIDLKVNKYVLKPSDPSLLLDALSETVGALMQKKEKDFNTQYIHFILDSQPTFMLATSKYEIEYINKTFLTFLGYNSLANFKRGKKKLENFFLNVKGIPSLSKTKKEWLQYIINNPARDVLVYFKNRQNPQGNPEIYLVSCARLPEVDKYFFSFTNITKMEGEKEELEKQAITDILTGVLNRKKLIDTLVAEMNRNLRYNTPLSLIMFDIDSFKAINDNFGHNIGDQILQRIARIVTENIRNNDTLARWGGDEFLILTPETEIKKAKFLAEKISSNITKFQFNKVGKVTSSFGVTQFNKNDNIDSFIGRADSALYKAKAAGRGKVSI